MPEINKTEITEEQFIEYAKKLNAVKDYKTLNVIQESILSKVPLWSLYYYYDKRLSQYENLCDEKTELTIGEVLLEFGFNNHYIYFPENDSTFNVDEWNPQFVNTGEYFSLYDDLDKLPEHILNKKCYIERIDEDGDGFQIAYIRLI